MRAAGWIALAGLALMGCDGAVAPQAGPAPGTGLRATAAQDTAVFDVVLPANVPPQMRPLVVYSFNRATAQVLSQECPSVGFDSGRDARTTSTMLRELIESGAREVDVRRALAAAQGSLDLQIESYIFSRGLVDSQPETFCAAARSEMASGSGIGTLLAAR